MTAVTAIRRAHDAGVVIACDGKNLVLRASHPPAAELIDLLKQHKADIVTLLETQNVGQDVDGFFKCGTGRSSAQARLEWNLPKAVSTPSVDLLPPGETVFPSEGTKGAECGEGGASVVRVWNEGEATPQAQEPDPNPNLPWPQPGETLLPGWGTRVSMEYRLRTASEDECLEWAKEPWQLKLVAKARGYSQRWVDQILLNRGRWNILPR